MNNSKNKLYSKISLFFKLELNTRISGIDVPFTNENLKRRKKKSLLPLLNCFVNFFFQETFYEFV